MPADIIVRKNVLDLTPREKSEFVHAVKTLKNAYTPGSKVSIYDQFVVTHVEAMGLMPQFAPTGPAAGVDAAHENDGFLPWHREFLREFEALLRSVNPKVTVPYWDWTDLKGLNVMLQNDFLGPNGQGGDVAVPNLGVFHGGLVQSGYFSQANGWVLNPEINVSVFTGQSYGSSLSRYVLGPSADHVISEEDQANVLALDDYEKFRLALEGFIRVDDKGNQTPVTYPDMHNYVHGLIGGGYLDPNTGSPVMLAIMANVPSSPYDPLFWPLHANVDRLWAEWQDNGHAGSAFYPSSGEPYGHNLNDRMWPWDGGESKPGNIGSGNLLSYLPHFPKDYLVTPADVLDFRKLGYRYDTTPTLHRKKGQLGIG